MRIYKFKLIISKTHLVKIMNFFVFGKFLLINQSMKESFDVTHCDDSVLGLSIGISHAMKNVNPFAWRSGAMDNLAYQNPLEWKQSAKESHYKNEVILKKIEDRMTESQE